MDTAGPGFFEVCGLTVGVMVGFVAFVKGVSWLVERLGRLVGRIAAGGLVHTQSDAEAAYTETPWPACNEIATEPATGSLNGLPADYPVEFAGDLVVTAAEVVCWADLRASYQGATS